MLLYIYFYDAFNVFHFSVTCYRAIADDEYSHMRAAGARIGGGQRNSLLH